MFISFLLYLMIASFTLQFCMVFCSKVVFKFCFSKLLCFNSFVQRVSLFFYFFTDSRNGKFLPLFLRFECNPFSSTAFLFLQFFCQIGLLLALSSLISSSLLQVLLEMYSWFLLLQAEWHPFFLFQ